MIEHHVGLIDPMKFNPYLMKGTTIRKLLVLPHEEVQDIKYVDNHHRIANTPLHLYIKLGATSIGRPKFCD